MQVWEGWSPSYKLGVCGFGELAKGFDGTIVFNENDWEYGEIGESIERTPANLQERLGARIPKAPMSLESCDLGLTFQLKMLEFMDSMNQETLSWQGNEGPIRQNS